VAVTEKLLSTTQNPLALAVPLGLAHRRPLRGKRCPCYRALCLAAVTEDPMPPLILPACVTKTTPQ
ncbi:ATR-interacting protein, partial [Dissostichus eleginoides]